MTTNRSPRPVAGRSGLRAALGVAVPLRVRGGIGLRGNLDPSLAGGGGGTGAAAPTACDVRRPCIGPTWHPRLHGRPAELAAWT